VALKVWVVSKRSILIWSQVVLLQYNFNVWYFAGILAMVKSQMERLSPKDVVIGAAVNWLQNHLRLIGYNFKVVGPTNQI